MTSAALEKPDAQVRSNERDHDTSRLAAVLLPLAFWLVLAAQNMFFGDRVTNDSAAYIDCAQSIREGRGFQVRVYDGLKPDGWEPIRLWPPGYPMLIAAAMSSGLSAPSAALAVSVLSSTLFVVVVLRYYATQLPLAFAMLLGIVFVSMRALLFTGTMCWSEGPYMLLTVVSLMCLMKGTSAVRPAVVWFLVAGLAGGLSWCVRNVAVALFASSLGYLAVQFPRLRFKGTALAGCAWLSGWALGSGWLVMWNISTFGELNPYSMPPSERSFLWNCARACFVIGKDLTGLGHARFSDTLLNSLLNKYVLLASAVAILLFVFGSLLFGSRRLSSHNLVRFVRDFLRDRRDRVLLLLFLGFYTLAIVVARSVYQWGEEINFRHFAPIYWIILLFVGFACEWLAGHVWTSKRWIRAVLLVGIGLVAALQISSMLWRSAFAETDKELRSLAAVLGREIPEGQLVLTDAIAPLRVFGNVNARRPPSPRLDKTSLTWDDIKGAGEDGRLWGFVIVRGDMYEKGEFGDVLKDIAANPAKFPELRECEYGRDVRVVKYVKRRSVPQTLSKDE